MTLAPIPENEEQRLKALLRYRILDTDFEESYDELTQLAATICDTSISTITLIDTERQWFKSRLGVDGRQSARDISFCAHSILQDDIFVVEDAAEDKRFVDNPFVTGNPGIRFYAAANLRTDDGYNIGTLCVIDSQPKKPTQQQLDALRILAKQVVYQLELRLNMLRLDDSLALLRELNITKDRMFSVIAHDLKSPFNGILGFSEMLVDMLNKPGMERQKDMAKLVMESGEAALALLNDLLEWAVLQQRGNQFEKVKLDFSSLAREVTEIVSIAAMRKEIGLKTQIEPNIHVKGDKHMLFSLIQNLLTNAVKFTRHGGAIELSLSSEEKTVKVTVRDNGVGIPPDRLAQLLKDDLPVSMLGTEKETGTGLGLNLCKQYVNKHGGNIWIESEVGSGTAVCFTIPKVTVEAGA